MAMVVYTVLVESTVAVDIRKPVRNQISFKLPDFLVKRNHNSNNLLKLLNQH